MWRISVGKKKIFKPFFNNFKFNWNKDVIGLGDAKYVDIFPIQQFFKSAVHRLAWFIEITFGLETYF